MSHVSNRTANLVFMLLPVNSASPQPMATLLRSTKIYRYRMLIPPRMFFPVSFYTDIGLKHSADTVSLTVYHCIFQHTQTTPAFAICSLKRPFFRGWAKVKTTGTLPHACPMPALLAMLSAVNIMHLLPSWRVFLGQQVTVINPYQNRAGTGDGTMRDHLLF